MLGFIASAWGFVSGFSLKQWLWAGGIAALVALGWQAKNYVQNEIAEAALIAEQAITIQLQQDEIATQATLLEQAQRAAAIAEEARLAAEERERELRAVRDAAIRAGDEDDGVVAPVLEDTLRALRGD